MSPEGYRAPGLFQEQTLVLMPIRKDDVGVHLIAQTNLYTNFLLFHPSPCIRESFLGSLSLYTCKGEREREKKKGKAVDRYSNCEKEKKKKKKMRSRRDLNSDLWIQSPRC